ncbi:Serine/threonine-protein kinase PknA [Aquisphaera giovannonii]|uniref:Serine/threonine-protein kinase PknA n=1 Tax=Aquisphaera giovannonii TaxID=406548 RepID=A0A5B9VU32_9BACT|nr:lanthionine synthetase LanC family protein [Aquisphaera giovannonii]QEH31579.1 Serine/threonine-protein kinase PknA [Aquisphaera giovannonii]
MESGRIAGLRWPQAAEYARALDRFGDSLGTRWRVAEYQTGRVRWRSFRGPGPLPGQGWKIHLSIAASEVLGLFDEVLPYLARHEASFKLPSGLEGYLLLNGGEAGRTQVGKALTVYPADDAACRRLAIGLDARWRSARGPGVPFGLRVGPASAVYLRYGAIGGRDVLVDAFGRFSPALRSPEGRLVEDRRDLPGGRPPWAPGPPVESGAARGGRLPVLATVGGRAYYRLKTLHSSAKGDVVLGVDAATGAAVVIKSARRGVGGDPLGHDAVERLSNEFRILSRLREAGGVAIAPAPLGLEAGETALLVLADVPGTPLHQLPRAARGPALAGLARAVASLHDRGFVHRDVKLSNAILGESGVCLIDFELACPAGHPAPIPGGTRGYLPPGDPGPADAAADCYALGATLAHAVLESDPGLMPAGRGRLIGLLHLARAHDAADLVRRLTDADPAARPRAEEAARRMEAAASGGPPAEGPPPRARDAGRRWAIRASTEAARAASGFLVAGPDGHWWRNRHLYSGYACEGINLGAAGVVLGLISVATALRDRRVAADVGPAIDWLSRRGPTPESPGLFTGDAGVALALVAGGPYSADPGRARDAALRRLSAAAASVEELDLFSGAAGVLWAGCLIAEISGDASPLRIVEHLAGTIVAAASEADGVVAWAPSGRLDGVRAPHVGAAHGAAGVALALAHWGRAAGDPGASGLAREVFAGLDRGARTPDGLSLRRFLGPGSPAAPLGDWCHGPAGYLWCLLQALGDDPRSSPAVDRAASAFRRASMVRNPTFCHGLAGQLELCRMLGALPRHEGWAARRGARIEAVLRLLQQRRGGGVVWSSEDPEVITPDLWVGFLGPAAALAMGTRPGHAPLLSGPWLRECRELAS